ncbi:MAG: carboxypeptidase regulatory-like domain-containing protein [Acidobacteria bacterium]|nr:MAG: carboxypeptidase regulatory-like domain-containing protein [Acidobacteriota bacterium]
MTRRWFVAGVILLAVVAMPAVAAAQRGAGPAPARDTPFLPAKGGGVIAGHVLTTDATPRPMRNVIVTLRGDGYRSGWTFITDADGAFNFAELPAGRFTLTATRAGYPSVNYGAARPGRSGTSIVLKDNERAPQISLRMPKGAVISGRVLDESGAPLGGARVSVGLATKRNGEQTMSFGGSDSTDDRGVFRVYGLPAGDYVVSVDARGFAFQPGAIIKYTPAEIDAVMRSATSGAAGASAPVTPPAGQEVVQLSAYYPSVRTLAEALPVHVDAGQERLDVDVTVSYAASVAISGFLLDAEGKPPAGVVMNLVQVGVVRTGPSVFGRPSPVDGSFSFAGNPPGRYVITARATTAQTAANGETPPLWARADVVVNGEPVTGVRMVLQEAADISGTVAFESVANTAPPSTLRIGLTAVLSPGEVGMGASDAAMTADRTFKIAGVPAGRFRVASPTIAAMPNWSMKSAILQGQDVLDEPFEVRTGDLSGLTITYTDQITEINGSLEDASGRPAPDFYIIVFPVDQKYWYQNSRRIRAVRPGLDGKYVIRGLPPGSYRIGAVTDVEQNDWFESWFLQPLLPASAEIVLGEGEKKAFPLKIGG